MLQNKLCREVVNVVEAFAVSLVFFSDFMLAPTLGSEIFYKYEGDRLYEIPSNIQNNADAVIVYVAHQ